MFYIKIPFFGLGSLLFLFRGLEKNEVKIVTHLLNYLTGLRKRLEDQQHPDQHVFQAKERGVLHEQHGQEGYKVKAPVGASFACSDLGMFKPAKNETAPYK